MFGDDYIVKIGATTESAAKGALYLFLVKQYTSALDEDSAGKLAAAVTNKVFGEHATGIDHAAFATEHSALIEEHARKLASDENLCSVLTGAAYNMCYSRYLRAGGSRGMFSNAFLTYIRCLSRDESVQKTRDKALGEITGLGSGILNAIDSMRALGMLRSIPDDPNERGYYDSVREFALAQGMRSSAA